MQQKNYNDTTHKILDAAEKFTQMRGFNAFSYKDIQEEVGVKTSSIHYYFATKQDLAHAMAERYIDRVLEKLDEIDARKKSADQKITALGDIFIGVLKSDKLCLCGMLCSDALSISKDVTDELSRFFDEVEQWCARVIRQGIDEEVLNPKLNSENAAAHFLAALEGAILIARTREDVKYMKKVVNEAISQMRM